MNVASSEVKPETVEAGRGRGDRPIGASLIPYYQRRLGGVFT
jgi:hypothetical protein